MGRCKICGRETNRLNTTTFIEKQYLGLDYCGKWEMQTTQNTYCNVCAAWIEQGMADGIARAQIMAAHDRRMGID